MASLKDRPDSEDHLGLHVNDLPDDILIYILSLLSRSERLKKAALVCTYWHNLTRDSHFWHKINFDGRKQINDVILGRVVRYGASVTSLDITRCSLVTDDGLLDVIEQCSALQSLKLAG